VAFFFLIGFFRFFFLLMEGTAPVLLKKSSLPSLSSFFYIV
jgi:hypothetical protein